MKLKPFKAWLLLDAEGTFVPGLHLTRRNAEEEAEQWHYLRDAKWRVVRVEVKPVRRTQRTTDRG